MITAICFFVLALLIALSGFGFAYRQNLKNAYEKVISRRSDDQQHLNDAIGADF